MAFNTTLHITTLLCHWLSHVSTTAHKLHYYARSWASRAYIPLSMGTYGNMKGVGGLEEGGGTRCLRRHPPGLSHCPPPKPVVVALRLVALVHSSPEPYCSHHPWCMVVQHESRLHLTTILSPQSGVWFLWMRFLIVWL